MKRLMIVGCAMGSIAFAPASWAQTLTDVQVQLRDLVAAHEAACSEPDVSEHGADRCDQAWSSLMDLRARVAILNTAVMTADMEDGAPPNPADVNQARQDVLAYASQQPDALADLSFQPDEPEEGEEGAEAEGEATADGGGE